MHSHASGISYARLSAKTYGITSQDRIGSHAPLHADMSTLGYLTGPYVGATTVIVPEPHTRLPASLSLLLEQAAISIWYSVPLALVQMLTRGALGKRELSALRWVMYGGEPLAPKYLRQLLQLVPHCRVSNVYGPAEVNQCTYYHIDKASVDAGEHTDDSQIPIGLPWAETVTRVLDENDSPVVEGDMGELVVHSSTMMLGYWNNPALNAVAYHQEKAEERKYYRTGDRVKALPDVGYVLTGRRDRQVKIRGFRIELDYVELKLAEHPAVTEAAAYLVETVEGDENHIAAAVLLGDKTADAADLMHHMMQRLPQSAVPASIRVS